MASTMIHIAVASELNKKLNRDHYAFIIGSIAPDIAKMIGDTKEKSHFLPNENDDVPDLYKFLVKYKYNLDDDFVLGYYVHLYTDYLWFKYFIPQLYDEDSDMITKLDGSVVKCNGNMKMQYIYNDYTNLNVKIIDEYNLDLRIFYNELPPFKNIITEIPMDRLNILLDKCSLLIENTKEHKDMIFNMDYIKQFVDLSVTLIENNLAELGIK